MSSIYFLREHIIGLLYPKNVNIWHSPLPAAIAGILAADWTKQAEPGTCDIQNLGSLGTQGHQAVIWAEQRFLGPNQVWALRPEGDPALCSNTAILVAAAWIERAKPDN